MGVRDAAKAVELVNPRLVIPMHYNTFDVIKQDPEAFKGMVNEKNKSIEVVILKQGASCEVPLKTGVGR